MSTSYSDPPTPDIGSGWLPTVYIPVGLPGCGKTRRAREMIAAHLAAGYPRSDLVRLSRDDLRTMMTNGYGKPQRGFEDMVSAAFDVMLAALLSRGVSVIVDATNLNPRYRAELIARVTNSGAEVVLDDLTGIPLSVCIARDGLRSGVARVGPEEIRRLHERYIAPRAGIVGENDDDHS